MQYTIVAVDCFTKLVEVEAVKSITLIKIKEFVYKNIICRYRVRHTIVSDNGTQFNYDEFNEFYDSLYIKKVLSLVVWPQANRQVEFMNQTIKNNLKMKLENLKGR